MSSLFKIEKLRQLASFALDSTDYQPADSARVRAVPDVRTIRYYTTLGLIDRPAEMQGRTAMYGLRHVEQLVAIKRLQAQGLTLSDIQHRMIGMPAEDLKKLARLPKDIQRKTSAANLSASEFTSPKETGPTSESSVATDETSSEPTSESSGELWRRVPQSRRPPVSGKSTETSRIKHIVRLPISAGVSIDVTLNHPATADFDLARIVQSAEPLLKELQRQQTISNRQSEGEVSQ